MLINATYNGEPCLLNTDYIVDVFNADKMVADVYLLDIDRDAYKVLKAELQRFLESEERNDEYLLEDVEWIPCDERLPEEDNFYLVTADHEHDKELRSTDMYYFRNGDWDTVHDDIIAWMPLPQPYMKGTDNE